VSTQRLLMALLFLLGVAIGYAVAMAELVEKGIC
jgi:hypothetical protein